MSGIKSVYRSADSVNEIKLVPVGYYTAIGGVAGATFGAAMGACNILTLCNPAIEYIYKGLFLNELLYDSLSSNFGTLQACRIVLPIESAIAGLAIGLILGVSQERFKNNTTSESKPHNK